MFNELYTNFWDGFSEAAQSKWMEYVVGAGFVFGGIAGLIYLIAIQ